MKNSNRETRVKIFLGMLVWSAFALFVGTPLEVFGQVTFEPGTFQGVLKSESNNDESFGFITVVLTASGKFSMRFNLGVNRIGYHRYAKTGMFDQNGAYHFEGPQVTESRFAIASVIDLQYSGTGIQGNVTDGTHSSTVELERIAVFAANNPAPETGRYTFLFSNSGDAGLPIGFGYGTAVVNSRGRISASGRSSDEMPFAQSAGMTVNGRWPFFARLGGSTHGILCGWLTFSETAQTDFDGTLTWLGSEVPGPNNAFVNEFSGDVSVAGSRYSVPPGTTVLQTTTSTNNVHLMLSGGGLETPIDRDLTLSSRNRFTSTSWAVGDSLSVNVAKGTFIGRFLHSDGFREIFRGAILQKQNFGGGHFVDREGLSGSAQLEPQ